MRKIEQAAEETDNYEYHTKWNDRLTKLINILFYLKAGIFAYEKLIDYKFKDAKNRITKMTFFKKMAKDLFLFNAVLDFLWHMIS